MSQAHADIHHDEHEHHHVSSMRLLNAILGVLLVLTVLTVAVSRVHFGETLNLWIAVGIAAFKALLVAAFFMHLLHDKAMNTIVLFFTILTIGFFLLFTLVDMGSRGIVDPLRDGDIAPPAIAAEARERAIAEGRLDPNESHTDDHSTPDSH